MKCSIADITELNSGWNQQVQPSLSKTAFTSAKTCTKDGKSESFQICSIICVMKLYYCVLNYYYLTPPTAVSPRRRHVRRQ